MWLVALVLVALALSLIIQALRRALNRPAPTLEAIALYSLATGKQMLLIGLLGSLLLGNSFPRHPGAPALILAGLGVLALLLQMFAERRWPRQSGAVRVATLQRRSLRQTVKTGYVVGAGIALGLMVAGVAFALTVGPAIPPGSRPDPCAGFDPNQCQSYAPGGVLGPLPPSPRTLLVTLGLVLLMTAVGTMALRQIVRRPALVGVPALADQRLRQLAAHRVMRSIVAMYLAVVVVVFIAVRDALHWGNPASLAEAVGSCLSWVALLCSLGILAMWLVGPDEASLRREGLLPPVLRRRARWRKPPTSSAPTDLPNHTAFPAATPTHSRPTG